MTPLSRRDLLAHTAGALTVLVLPCSLAAAAADIDVVYQELFGARRPQPGGVQIDVSQVVENGNSVALKVSALQAPTPPSLLHLIMPRNPEPWGASFAIHPPARAEISTRIRLSMTQNLTAVAEWPDGALRGAAVSVLVTLGACIEENFGQWIR